MRFTALLRSAVRNVAAECAPGALLRAGKASQRCLTRHTMAAHVCRNSIPLRLDAVAHPRRVAERSVLIYVSWRSAKPPFWHRIEPPMARFGYARVSSTDQDLAIQLAKLKGRRLRGDPVGEMSGKSADDRPELATVMQFLREGDELVVVRLDRLGRSTRDVLKPRARVRPERRRSAHPRSGADHRRRCRPDRRDRARHGRRDGAQFILERQRAGISRRPKPPASTPARAAPLHARGGDPPPPRGRGGADRDRPRPPDLTTQRLSRTQGVASPGTVAPSPKQV